MPDVPLLRLDWSWERGLLLELSPWLILLCLGLIVGLRPTLSWIRRRWFGRYDVVEVEIPMGNIGKVRLRPNRTDSQIAHQIWTELVTRKAAIRIDPDRDVISEVYDSWYTLFRRIRELIANIDADLVRREESTQKLVDIATRTLNDGLRPHLTRWQAEFRNWLKHHDEDLRNATPQEVQRTFPHYRDLVSDMQRVNEDLIRYASELKKIAHGCASKCRRRPTYPLCQRSRWISHASACSAEGPNPPPPAARS